MSRADGKIDEDRGEGEHHDKCARERKAARPAAGDGATPERQHDERRGSSHQHASEE